MNSTQRFFIGLLASVLFTIGFSNAAHAAEKTLGLTVSATKSDEGPAGNCTSPCHWSNNS